MNLIKYRTMVFILTTGGLLMVVTMLLETQPGRAAGPWYVTPGGDDSNDCLSPGAACATINGAISKASPESTIFVAQGTYTGTDETLVSIDKDILLSGGWDAEFATRSGTSLLDGQDQHRCLSVSAGVTVRMERFTLQSGYVENENGAGIENLGNLDFVHGEVRDNEVNVSQGGVFLGGGGVYNHGTLALVDCEIAANLGGNGSGGGIYNEGVMTITDCDVEHNSSSGYSGGGVCSSGTMTMTGGSLSSNLAPYGRGGGLSALGSSAVLTNVVISDNGAESHGGGIFLDQGELLISNCDVISNTLTYANGTGGGMYSYKGNVAIYESLISNNQYGGVEAAMESMATGSLLIQDSTVISNAVYGVAGAFEEDTLEIKNCEIGDNQGAGVTIACGRATISGSSIYGNTDSGISISCSSNGLKSVTISSTNIVGNQGWRGAGIRNYQGTFTMTNSAVIGNVTTGEGGGLRNQGWSTITNTTFTLNQASSGGGIYNSSGLTAAHLTIYDNTASVSGGIHDKYGWSVLRNSIIAKNSGGNCALAVGSEGNNIEDANTCGLMAPGDRTDTDPVVKPLSMSSGTYVYPLRWSSPAVDHGNPAYCPATDQRGYPRIGRCDIGAYELQPIGFSTKSANETNIAPSEPFTYTIVLTNGGVSDLINVHVTDTLPISLSYIEDSLYATGGSYGYGTGVITWTGSVNSGEAAIITFGATVNQTAPLGTPITNSATISGGGEIITRTATVHVVTRVYLPVVLKGGD